MVPVDVVQVGVVFVVVVEKVVPVDCRGRRGNDRGRSRKDAGCSESFQN